MRSHLLEGKVRHRRAAAVVYALEHDVFYAALDLDELDEVARSRRASSAATAGTSLAFRDADHLVPPAADLPAAVAAHLRAEGRGPDGWRITLVTNLRVFGYVFNPASFFLCRDAAGDLARRGRRGPQHPRRAAPVHASARATTAATFVASMDKAFYVSPFIEMDGQLHGPRPGRAEPAADRDQRGQGRRAAPRTQPRPARRPPDRPDRSSGCCSATRS